MSSSPSVSESEAPRNTGSSVLRCSCSVSVTRVSNRSSHLLAIAADDAYAAKESEVLRKTSQLSKSATGTFGDEHYL